MGAQDYSFAKKTMDVNNKRFSVFNVPSIEKEGIAKTTRLPFIIKILIENMLRHLSDGIATPDHLNALLHWPDSIKDNIVIPFMPSRVILQDFTGVPAIVDLSALRWQAKRLGMDPNMINPFVPSELVIDHSIQVDFYGTSDAINRNEKLEFERNKERYKLLKWAKKAFDKFLVIPPSTGIIHQVNLEFLARVIDVHAMNQENIALFDTLVGTDSHTTMIDGLGVLGFGVGGIEAEAVMLGQPYYMLVPEIMGFKLTGSLKEGVTATDLVLTITWILRQKGVVGKFVEFFGNGLNNLSLPDRATISNMSPEFGATAAFFPIDEETLKYLRLTGRSKSSINLIEVYAKEQTLFRNESSEQIYSETLELDLSTVEPTLAGPKRPQDKVYLKNIKETFNKEFVSKNHKDSYRIKFNEDSYAFDNGSIVIASITSCTNTSNPELLVGAGLIAKNAVKKGLKVKPFVKTSLAPGSSVVIDYLKKVNLLPYLEAIGFHVVGFGCMTCIGNSGPIAEPIEKEIKDHSLTVAAILSGNRNFEARVHPLVRANYLASPILVVAYALAGKINIDLYNDPIGHTPSRNPVYLKDLWPSPKEIRETIESALVPEMFINRYKHSLEGNEEWKSLKSPKGSLFDFDPKSTYIKEPPFFTDFSLDPPDLSDIRGARVLAILGDSITTDHISPAGNIPKDSPAGKYLIANNVHPKEFNSYGSRRGNHEVMIRGTFANVRIKNLMLQDIEGGFTIHTPTGKQKTIYDAAMEYKKKETPLIVIAGKEYGSGSSRDWAAKGTALLGVKAVIAVSYERIHRSNLIGMGVLPLQFIPNEDRETLGLKGLEAYDIEGIKDNLTPSKEVIVKATKDNGNSINFKALVRLDNLMEVEYYKNGGILQMVLRKLVKDAR